MFEALICAWWLLMMMLIVLFMLNLVWMVFLVFFLFNFHNHQVWTRCFVACFLVWNFLVFAFFCFFLFWSFAHLKGLNCVWSASTRMGVGNDNVNGVVNVGFDVSDDFGIFFCLFCTTINYGLDGLWLFFAGKCSQFFRFFAFLFFGVLPIWRV